MLYPNLNVPVRSLQCTVARFGTSQQVFKSHLHTKARALNSPQIGNVCEQETTAQHQDPFSISFS
jgi:hypothetical protein